MIQQDRESAELAEPLPLPAGTLAKYPWITFLLPFLVYMLVGTLEPAPPEAAGGGGSSSWFNLDVPYRYYPWIYSIKIVLTVVTMLTVLPGYRTFPLRLSPLSFVVGGFGSIAWIVLSELRLEAKALGPLGLVELGERPAFNPLEQLGATPAWAYAFLAIRFFGLVAVVPIIEEFFLRGFIMRYVVQVEWWRLGFHQVNRAGIMAGTVFPMLYHGEMLAALVWFSAVTWLMLKTRNIWDCVVAHALTNLVLGIYVVTMDRWHLM